MVQRERDKSTEREIMEWRPYIFIAVSCMQQKVIIKENHRHEKRRGNPFEDSILANYTQANAWEKVNATTA